MEIRMKQITLLLLLVANSIIAQKTVKVTEQTLKIKQSLTKNWEIIKKMQSGGSQKAATDSTQIKKG